MNRLLASILLAISFHLSNALATPNPAFVDLSMINSEIQIEIRYSSTWNFTGQIVNGYKKNTCYLTHTAAKALSQVAVYVKSLGYSLLVFDCYRPQRAVTEFVNWTRDSTDQKLKSIFYPIESKETLVARGYIADRSSHSRGSTVDLTLVKLKGVVHPRAPNKWPYQEEPKDCRRQDQIGTTGQAQMGTIFDCFDSLANTDQENISAEAKENRRLLAESMGRFGFVNYPKEWWHYTLKNEPFRNQYFDFVVE